MLDALGFSGGAAGVEDEQRRFAVDAARRGIRPRRSAISSCHQKSRPAFISTSGCHWLRQCRCVEDDALLDGRDFRERLVDVCLSGSALPRRQPPSAVICSLASASLLRSAMASAEKPPKMTEWIAPIRAGQHGDRQLGHHRHVDRDAVARLNAELLEHVGELADFAVQLGVGQLARVARLAFPEDGGAIAQPAARLRSRQL